VISGSLVTNGLERRLSIQRCRSLTSPAIWKWWRTLLWSFAMLLKEYSFVFRTRNQMLSFTSVMSHVSLKRSITNVVGRNPLAISKNRFSLLKRYTVMTVTRLRDNLSNASFNSAFTAKARNSRLALCQKRQRLVKAMRSSWLALHVSHSTFLHHQVGCDNVPFETTNEFRRGVSTGRRLSILPRQQACVCKSRLGCY
jgi:hypothetical protein